jgi:hypothetical protein
MIYFGSHNISNAVKVVPGIGTLTVDVPFVPDYIKVEFHGPALSPKEPLPGTDDVYWNLTTVTPTSYQLTIGWSVYNTREIYYRISRLIVDPV